MMRGRAAGVILHDEHVLLQGEPCGTFWTLPGGGIESDEPSPLALQREIKEELGAEITIDRLLWITEEFFGTGQQRQHQIGFYYLIKLSDARHLYALDTPLHAKDGGTEITSNTICTIRKTETFFLRSCVG